MTFKIQKTVDCTPCSLNKRPMRISYKAVIRSANRNESVPGCNIIDDCFQQSSRANALQWSQTNVAGNRKKHICKWQRSLCAIRGPLKSAPRESARRTWSPPDLWQACTRADSRAQSRWTGTGRSACAGEEQNWQITLPECCVAHQVQLAFRQSELRKLWQNLVVQNPGRQPDF